MFQATQNITSVHIQVTIERSREAFIAGTYYSFENVQFPVLVAVLGTAD